MTPNDNELRGIFKKGYGRICKYLMIYNKVSMQAKAVYCYLCSFAGAKDTVYPSREKICNDLDISQNSLTKYILELVENNIISVSKNLNANNTYANNIYTINSDLEQRFKSLIEASSTSQISASENIKNSLPKICVTENLNNGNLMDGELLSNNNTLNKNKTNNNKDFNNNTLNNNKDSNNNRESKNSLQTFQSIFNNFSNNSSLVKTLTNFVNFREKLGKPFLTEESVEAFLETLNKISDDETKIECLNYSMSNNWTTIYPDFKDKQYKKENTEKYIKSKLKDTYNVMDYLSETELGTLFKTFFNSEEKAQKLIKKYEEKYFTTYSTRKEAINYDDPKDDEKYIYSTDYDKDTELNFVHEWTPKEKKQVDIRNMTDEEFDEYLEDGDW